MKEAGVLDRFFCQYREIMTLSVIYAEQGNLPTSVEEAPMLASVKWLLNKLSLD